MICGEICVFMKRVFSLHDVTQCINLFHYSVFCNVAFCPLLKTMHIARAHPCFETMPERDFQAAMASYHTHGKKALCFNHMETV